MKLNTLKPVSKIAVAYVTAVVLPIVIAALEQTATGNIHWRTLIVGTLMALAAATAGYLKQFTRDDVVVVEDAAQTQLAE